MVYIHDENQNHKLHHVKLYVNLLKQNKIKKRTTLKISHGISGYLSN